MSITKAYNDVRKLGKSRQVGIPCRKPKRYARTCARDCRDLYALIPPTRDVSVLEYEDVDDRTFDAEIRVEGVWRESIVGEWIFVENKKCQIPNIVPFISDKFLGMQTVVGKLQNTNTPKCGG